MQMCPGLSFGVETRWVDGPEADWIYEEPTGVIWFECRACRDGARGLKAEVMPRLRRHVALTA